MFTQVTYMKTPEEDVGQRIDNFLLKTLKGVPKSRIYRLLRKGEIRVNRKRIKPDYRLQAEDELRIAPIRTAAETAIPPTLQSKALFLKQQILYEDNSLLVLNKPAGVPVHGGTGLDGGAIEALRLINEENRFLELIHRIDKGTSGCLLIAKKKSFLKAMHELLSTGQIQKKYLAIVHGHWPNYLRKITSPLMKNQLQSGERIVKVNPEGKEAVTEVRVIERFANMTLIEASPLTGRTHQIRVHAASEGFPILGDSKYGNSSKDKELRDTGVKVGRMFLHAASVSFVSPATSQPFTVEAKMPKEFQMIVEKLKKSPLNPLTP